jgi:phosphoglucosamine mutase
MEKLPQRLVNVRLPDRAAVERAADGAEMVAAVQAEQDALAGRGRVLVRASGTEPLLRVMVEAPSAEEADVVCGRLVERAEAAAVEAGR